MAGYARTLVLLWLGMATGAVADEAGRCVQEQLSALGHYAGAIDGQIGRQSLAAFAALKSAQPEAVGAVDAPDFSASSALAWCVGLGGAFSEAEPVYLRYQAALESGFTFDVADNVPPAQVEQIEEGLSIARAYIARTFGEDIPLDARKRMTVKIVATGKGNTEPGGGGGAATAMAMGLDVPRPFFDVANEQWSQNTQGRGWTTRADNLKTVVHEYAHGWQMMLGAMDINNQPLGNWMNEGIAEYVGYSAMADAGLIKWSDAQRFMLRSSAGEETAHSLEAFGTTQSPAWAGHVGFVALDWLITDTGNGIVALKSLADEINAGRSQRQAFANTFGIELADFYRQFDDWAKAIRANPDSAMAKRPKLVLTQASAEPADVSAPAAVANDMRAPQKCIQAALNARGFAVGTVDGVIGGGTQGAFDLYKRDLDARVQRVPLQDGTHAMWCLYMTGSLDLDADLAQLRAQVETGARVMLAFKLPQEARFRLIMRRGDTEVATNESIEWIADESRFRAEFDYRDVATADNLCAYFLEGWKVKDAAGKTYLASCDPIIPAMLTAGPAIMSYALAAPEPSSVPGASDGILSTQGDPNPGLELIPGGWNGIYRSAERRDGKWHAQKYSGEVDTYATCRLLDETYIICQ
jgi:hypothetical protein